MKKYELTVLIKTGQTSEARDKFVDRVEKMVKALGGAVGKHSELGKKQLAYRMKGVLEADFMMWVLELPAAGVVELRKKLTVDRDITRFLLVKAS